MGCRDSSKVRVHPGNQQSQFVRVNGWTRPFHYLQIVAWVVLLVFALVYFAVVAAAVATQWKPAAYVCVGIVYVAHVITNLAAITKNPADGNAKTQIKQNHQMPDFDRSKHQHVIENEYCHLCETYVSKTSKHCRACNKCVADFDHHCLWLNNCVGGVNYRYFLATITSAFIGSFIIAAVSLFVFINSLLDFQDLDSDVWWRSVSTELFQVFVGILIVLCLICSILLGQLLFFHLYLIRRGLTTYEYIQNSRAKKEEKHGKINSVLNVSAEEDAAPCATPPSIIDTVVTTTNTGAVVVQAPEPVMENSKKLDIENQTSYDAMLDSNPHKFVASNSAAVGDIKGNHTKLEDETSPSHSEFTNAAFSADEPRNTNMNSNAIYASQTSINGSLSQRSSLGELRSWDNGHLSKSVDMIVVSNHDHTSPISTARQISKSPDGTNKGVKDSPTHVHPSAGVSEAGPTIARRQKRKRSSKRSHKHLEDGMARPLPALPEVLNASISQGELRKKTLLPPLRSSMDWASSSEDLHSNISSQRKLPSITPSSSVNSFASYASGNVTSNYFTGNPHA